MRALVGEQVSNLRHVDGSHSVSKSCGRKSLPAYSQGTSGKTPCWCPLEESYAALSPEPIPSMGIGLTLLFLLPIRVALEV